MPFVFVNSSTVTQFSKINIPQPVFILRCVKQNVSVVRVAAPFIITTLKNNIKSQNIQQTLLSETAFIWQVVMSEGSHSSLPRQLGNSASHTLSRSEPENNTARGLHLHYLKTKKFKKNIYI